MNAEPRSAVASRRLLIVEDDEPFRERLARAMRARGFDTIAVADHAAAVGAARADSPGCAVVDLRLPGTSGLRVVRDLKAIDDAMTIVVLTGYGSIATAVESVKLGATMYLTKPADADQITAALDPDAPSPLKEPPHPPSLARVEWEHIQRVLVDCDGNITRAARALGIHRRSLQRKLDRLQAPR